MTVDANSASLLRPIIGIENRTAQEVFDIMCDRFRLAASPASDHAGLVERLKSVLKDYDDDLARTIAAGVLPDRFAYGEDVSGVTYADLREAATALSAASPAPLEGVGVTPIGYARSVDVDPKHRPMEGRISFWCTQNQNAYYSVPVYLSAIVGSAKELVERAFKDGLAYGSNVEGADPETAWMQSRVRASLTKDQSNG